MPMNREQRLDLVRALRFDAGQAEVARPETVSATFYPVAEHLRALEPESVLIVGDRGAGKSMLKRVATNGALRQAVIRRAGGLRAPTGDTTWIDGYPLQAKGPNAAGWEQFATARRADGTALQELWFAYLARVLGDRLDTAAQNDLAALLASPGGDPETCFTEFKKAGVAVLLALDRLDQELAEKDRWIFVAYDELDTILFSDWEAMGAIIRGLISFWASHSRRWQRIRAKLFLRTDFYRHHSDVVGADIAKLAASRVEMAWSDKNLYAVLVKQIANQSRELLEYCGRSVSFEAHDPVLGHIPKILRREDAQPLVERLAGKHMGSDKKKGKTFNWLLDHVRDGNGKASPRSLVLLIENAAVLEIDNPRARGANLVHPISLRNALDKVSEQHVRQTMTEFAWLEGVKERLAPERKVPWPRKTLEKLLAADWDKSWGRSSNVRPPATSPRELVDTLVELGILRDRGRDSFDVPDLFLWGLDLRRRGGVQKR